MARTRHRRRRHRNPSRNQWIAIGVSTAIVLTGGTILVVRRRRQKALTGGTGTGNGGTQGTSLPTGGTGHKQLQSELSWLCKQPGTISLAAQQALINGIYIPAMNRELAKLPPQLTPNQVDNVVSHVANVVLEQTCQPVSSATMQISLKLSHAAWLKTQGLSGQ